MLLKNFTIHTDKSVTFDTPVCMSKNTSITTNLAYPHRKPSESTTTTILGHYKQEIEQQICNTYSRGDLQLMDGTCCFCLKEIRWYLPNSGLLLAKQENPGHIPIAITNQQTLKFLVHLTYVVDTSWCLSTLKSGTRLHFLQERVWSYFSLSAYHLSYQGSQALFKGWWINC